MNYKEETEKLLKIAKSKGFTRRDIEQKLGKSKEWIAQGLSRGGNRDMYNQISVFIDSIAASNIAQRNEPATVPMGKYVAMLEKTNSTLDSAIQLSLNQIQANQAVMLKLLHSVYDQSAEIKAVVTGQPVHVVKEALNRKAGAIGKVSDKHRLKQ